MKKRLTLPMFPLNMVLFPGETTKVHVFEDRYRHLVDDCMRNGASFGIPFHDKGRVQPYGCEVKISRILKTYENGASDILLECTGVFRMLQYTPVLSPKLYPAGLAENLGAPQRVLLPALQDITVNYFSTVQNKIIDYDTVAMLTVYSVASALQLTNAEKYRLISAPDQQVFLLNMLNFIIHIINTEQHLRDRFINN